VMDGAKPQTPGLQQTSPGASSNQPGSNVDMLVFREYGGVVSEILRIVKLMTKDEQIDLLKDLGARDHGSAGQHKIRQVD